MADLHTVRTAESLTTGLDLSRTWPARADAYEAQEAAGELRQSLRLWGWVLVTVALFYGALAVHVVSKALPEAAAAQLEAEGRVPW